MPNNKFCTQICEACKNPYIKVFFLDDSDASSTMNVVQALQTVRKVTIGHSNSISYPGANLTVYLKPMVGPELCEKEVVNALNNYYSNMKVGIMKPSNDAHFREIESRILDALNKALATIDVCVAWFTNDKFRDKLLEKQNEGVAIRVIIYKDGTNHNKGVDLSGLRHKEHRGEKGGILHDKFCVIDNVTTISGSYNWTVNAEKRNDEDASFHFEDYKFASMFTKRFNEIWYRDNQ